MGKGQSRRLGVSLTGLLVLLLVLPLLLSSCTRSRSAWRARPPAMHVGLPRISPGYVQWLVRQSMLSAADQFISQVSGTNRVWKTRDPEGRIRLLLETAPTWLLVQPGSGQGSRSAFRACADQGRLTSLAAAGIHGLFLSPTGETGEVWSGQGRQTSDFATVSLSFAPGAGSEDEFEQLLASASSVPVQLGGTLPPVATGIGPDFLLALRTVQEFEGLYTLTAIPRSHWHLLPSFPETSSPSPVEWLPLSQKTIQSLRDDNILPAPFLRDTFPWADPCGWYVTNEIASAGGTTNRFAYYARQNGERPLLLWQDPSNRARKILSAAVIRHTGLQQQTLAGITLRGLYGMEQSLPPSRAGRLSDNVQEKDLDPARTALQDLSDEIQRYGGWSVLCDPLPAAYLPSLLERTDFVQDTYLFPALSDAMLSGDTDTVKRMVRRMLQDRIPQERLVHGLYGYIDEDRSPDVRTDIGDMRQKDRSGNTSGPSQTTMPYDGNRSSVSFQTQLISMGLPGLTFVHTDLLRTDIPQHSSLSDRDRPVSDDTTARILQARLRLAAAEGRLLPCPASPGGTLVLMNHLPDDAYWLTFCNFSQQKKDIPVHLPDRKKISYRLEDLTDTASSHASLMTKAEQQGIVTLNPREIRILIAHPAAHPDRR